MSEMISAPRMLLIGAEEKDAGKTTLSQRIIGRFADKVAVYGVKITVLRGYDGKKGFTVWEEMDPGRKKDTGRLLAAGARRVFWVKTDEEHVGESVRAVMDEIPGDAAVVCESNAARLYVEPALFIMVRRDRPAGEKRSAAAVKHLVDRFAVSSIKEGELTYEPDVLETLRFTECDWELSWREES